MKYFALSFILKVRVLEIWKWSTYRYRLMFIDIAMYRHQGRVVQSWVKITQG